MLDQSLEVVRDLDILVYILEFDELNYFIKNIFDDEMIHFLSQLTVIYQSQIQQIMHLELDDACRRLDLLEHI